VLVLVLGATGRERITRAHVVEAVLVCGGVACVAL
jgi:hypothetical protein